jgi:hypothetical protein
LRPMGMHQDTASGFVSGSRARPQRCWGP